MKNRIECCGATDIGRHRTSNQDQYLIADLIPALQVYQTSLKPARDSHFWGDPLCKLLVIADGMGGHAAGERASALAINSLLQYMLTRLNWSLVLDPAQRSQFPDELAAAVEYCQNNIVREMSRHPEQTGMGTTLTVACICQNRLYVAHVGDSRCYLWRDGQLRQLTRDHTMAQHFLEGGALGAKEAQASPWNNILWNVVGGGISEVRPELHEFAIRAGDKLLLCSDGLTRHVSNRRIGALLDYSACGDACRKLVEEANTDGGTDNVTVVVAHIESLVEPEPPRSKHVAVAPASLLSTATAPALRVLPVSVGGNSLDPSFSRDAQRSARV